MVPLQCCTEDVGAFAYLSLCTVTFVLCRAYVKSAKDAKKSSGRTADLSSIKHASSLLPYIRRHVCYYMEEKGPYPLMNSEMASVYVNLLKTVVGAALIKYPYLFMKYGMAPTLAISIMSAVVAYFGLVLYVDLNSASGTKTDISSLACNTRIPSLKTAANAAIFLKCYSVIIIYMHLLKGVLKTLLKHFFNTESYYIALLALVILATPFTLVRNIRSLRLFSLLGVGSVVLIISLCAYRFTTEVGRLHAAKLVIVTQSRDYVSDLGTFVFSYTCHQNILSVQNGLKKTSMRALKGIMLAVLGTSVLIYSAFGMVCGMMFGMKINEEENILNLLPDDCLSLSMRIFYVITLVFTIPLHSHPGTHYGLCIFNSKYATEMRFWYVRCTFSIFLMLVMYLFVCIDSQGKYSTFNLVGGVFSSLINLGFPGFYYLTFRNTKKSRTNTLFSMIVLFFAVANIAYTVGAKICKYGQ